MLSEFQADADTGCQMDHEFDELLTDLDIKSSNIFQNFMTRIAKIEELKNVGNQLLMNFHQELVFFRRPPLQKTSKVIQDVIEANQTGRLKAYIESGCRHAYADKQNICKLNLCQQGLQDHLTKVKSQVDELECMSEDAIAIMQTVNQRISCLFDKCSSDGCMYQAHPFEEVEPLNDQGKYSNEENETIHPPGETILLRAVLMRAVYNMLKLDYEMQPFINDDIMQQCWRLIPQ